MRKIITKQIMKVMESITAITTEMDTTNARNMVTMLVFLVSMDTVKYTVIMACKDTMEEVTDTMDQIMDTMPVDTMEVVDMEEVVMVTMVIMVAITAIMDTIRLLKLGN